ncbi:MAG: zinc ribbon domain-containing protein [candidate division KSB1 bacterium]|nr:zinc ribbon domain-containing protein [candidate division KSB1 bacterium]MDZ7304675.1 zinc ribbon domain-containing protein [candidate division KSB1 bacterium]MDZ7313793.1 zinc ribbon domain-containing protein [candidate division KSB1 bacterium]
MVEIIGILLAILTAVFVGYPLFQKQQRKVSFAVNHRAQELEARKAEIYAAIRDIDFDYRMGKLSQEDYQALRDRYKAEAIDMMKQIDALMLRQSRSSSSKGDGKEGSGQSRKTTVSSGKKLRFCPQCGQPVEADDRFCSACGGKLR